jgi:hypothetical protein
MTGKITITNIGENEGPFNLYSNTDGYSSAFEADVTRGELLAGFGSDLIPDGTSVVRATSISLCNSSIDITITTYTTTTTTTLATTTTTTTVPPVTTTTTTIPPVTTTTTTLFPPVTTTTTTLFPPVTTTTTSTLATTTTTTTAAPQLCTIYELLNVTQIDVEYSYVPCGGTEVDREILFLQSFEPGFGFCAVNGTLFLGEGIYIQSEAPCVI